MSTSIKRLLAGALLALNVSFFAACGDMNDTDPSADLDDEEETIPAVYATSNKKVKAPPAKSPRRPVERLQADDSGAVPDAKKP